jgi:hypothetical protein
MNPSTTACRIPVFRILTHFKDSISQLFKKDCINPAKLSEVFRHMYGKPLNLKPLSVASLKNLVEENKNKEITLEFSQQHLKSFLYH